MHIPLKHLLSLVSIAALAGCGVSERIVDKDTGMALAVKPAGVIAEHDEEEFEMGPAPYGHYRIVGEPVPDWQPPGFAQRANPLTWTFIGPRPISSEYWSGEANAGGRVVSIAPHPTDANTVYIGTASGGVWKTTNGGTTWTPLTDTLSTLNHGAVAVDPVTPTTVYAATGEYQSGTNGDGLFRSLDSGVTWARIATTAQVGSRCSGLVVNGQTIHVTGSAGYHRSLNGGANWSTLLSGSCSALRVDPVNPQIVYVARSGQGIYKSTNGGGSFALMNNGLPAAGSYSRIVMDISKTNPQVLYAAFLSGGNSAGVYKTTDAGATWTATAAPNFCYPQCSYDAYVGVSPLSENTVFLGGVDPRYATAGILRSLDGGATWAEMTGNNNRVHPDHHTIAWGPTNIIWEGNDGGVWKSTNAGVTWTNVNSTLAASQMYHIALHPTSTARFLGGTQDNGTPERTAESTNWPQLQTGDGGFSAFDPTTTTRRYTTYVYLTLYRWVNSGATDISGPWSGDSINWIAPFVIDPNSSTTIVAGTNRVWRTTDATAATPTWTALSDVNVSDGNTINYIAVAKGASNTIYSGNSAGGVWVTTNGTLWNRRSVGLPSGQISTIVIDPSNPARAYVAYYNTTGGRVFRTTTTGASGWSGVTGTLPSGVAARALAVDFQYEPPVLYVGAGSGVYVSFDDGATWTKNDSTLPNVNIGSLAINTTTRQIVAGTYGRGAWRAALASPPTCFADFNNDGGIDGADVEAFFTAWGAGSATADVNEDGGVDGADVETFFIAWQNGGC
ncbi:MAG: hypothetical protein JSR77_02290 [Planctomycetes bacterium]|nr:hypothetical protein [Planctomycetota bacterium]